MHEEDILLRSIRGIAYLAIAPCIFLSAAVWFTSDSIGIVIANLFQVYFSIFLLFLFGNIWSFKFYFKDGYESQLIKIAITLLFLTLISAILTIYINPAWGIGFLMVGVYLTRLVIFNHSIFKEFSKIYIDLFNRISIILCICLMLIFTYWLNPYTNPIATYI